MVLVRLGLIPALSRASCELCSGRTHVLKLPENCAVRPGAVRPGAVRPGAVRPGAVRPGAVRPGAVRPGAV